MTIPDAAIEAAAEGAWRGGNPEAVVSWAELDPFAQSIWRDRARAAIEAAMPAIREAIAQPLADFNIDTDPVPPGIDVPDDYESGMHDAARIVRGGTP